MATRREKDKQKRRKSDAQAWAHQQGSSGMSTCVKLPDGVEFWKPTPGTHLLDFMLYVVGKNNPRADEDMLHFERTYDAHRVPTADGARLFACRLKCFGKSCYGCDWLRNNSRTADQDLVKQMRATTRHLWLVNDKPGDKKNPLKVFDSNHFNKGMGFGEMMADALGDVPEYRNFADLEGGMTLQLKVKEDTFPGGKYNKVTRIDFLPRKYSYPESLLEDAPCLDECIVLVSNEDFKLAMEGGSDDSDDKEDNDTPKKSLRTSRQQVNHDEDEDEDDDKPVKKKKEATADEVGLEAGDEVEYEDDTCVIKSISRDGTSLTLENDEGDLIKGVGPDEVEKLEAKPKKKGKSAKQEEDDEDLEDDEDEDEDDDIPVKKKAPAKKGQVVEEDEDEDEEELDDEDEDDEDEDDEDEPPAKKTARRR